MLCLLLILCLLPIPCVHAEGDGEDSGSGGSGGSTTYITVNGGNNTLGSADDVSVSTSITNITANNVTVYVDGDYNPQYLFKPRITELHMINNQVGALWNPVVEEIPSTFHAAIMQQAKIAILYDGWIDLENKGNYKPSGARRYCEVMGYDIYAKLGEFYTQNSDGSFSYAPLGGLYSEKDPVNYTWAMMQLYRAMGIEKVHYYAQTCKAPEDYDINTSPIIHALTMPMAGPDLSAALTNVAATRTLPEEYEQVAAQDGISAPYSADKLSQHISLSDFCILASELMHIYGEPVLTEQETLMLLQAYGRELPYGLPSNAVEAIKYLLARGIVEPDMDWRGDLTFETAATLLMRIKDEGSRLTFKEITLTADVGLLAQGFHPIDVIDQQAPIAIVDSEEIPYANYTTYDYFVECVDAISFKSAAGSMATPFLCNGSDNKTGMLTGSTYLGIVTVKGHRFYHFTVEQTVDSVVKEGAVHVNTAVEDDAPHRYVLPAPSDPNPGGFYLYTGESAPVSEVRTWEWLPLDNEKFTAPAEYCDKARKAGDIKTSTTQTSLFSKSSYGFTVRVYDQDLENIAFKDAADADHTLKDVTSAPMDLPNNWKLSKEKTIARYTYFTVAGCDNKNTLAEIFTCNNKAGYQSFSAYSKQDDQYLVSVDYLKALGVVWEFTETGDKTYYIGTHDAYTGQYTDIFVNMQEKASYAVRGTQLTIYPEDKTLVTKGDIGYYVDYELVLGIARAVSFKNQDGTVALSKEPQIPKGTIKASYVRNANNFIKGADDTYAASEWLYTVGVKDSTGASKNYIYAPMSYVIANWVAVDNQLDMSKAVFSFYPATAPDAGSESAKLLKDCLGVTTESTGWNTYSTIMKPESAVTVDFDGKDFKLAESVSYESVMYVPSLEAFLLEPYVLGNKGTTYGSFQTLAERPPTSIVETATGVFADWNYNLYSNAPGAAVHIIANKAKVLRDVSSWTGAEKFPTATYQTNYKVEAVGAAGVPGLLGAPVATSWALTTSKNVSTYSGMMLAVRDGEGSRLTAGASSSAGDVIEYVLIHATPKKAWLQSAGFKFTYLDTSVLGNKSGDKPNPSKGDAHSNYDWEGFLRDLGLDDADDWLTILIIAVLNILPSVFMFIFIILLGLSLIADVKPWQLFCDKVFDPYRFLTLGRKNVHTIRVKMVFIYSWVALILYGLFQNGRILEMIAWAARAVVGIIRR